MSVTRPSLLRRLRQGADPRDWERFVDLFSVHLFLWACRAGLQGEEAANLMRGVFAEVRRTLPSYRPESPGGFRAWLRTLAHRQRREMLVRQPVPAGARAPSSGDPPPVPPTADAMWEGDYLPVLMRAAVDAPPEEIAASDWKVCQALTVEGRAASEVARDLAMAEADVYAAESRVLRRIRNELDGMLD